MASTKTACVATASVERARIPAGLPAGITVCAYCGGQITTASEPSHVATGEVKCKNVSRKEIRAYGHDQAWAHANAYEVWQSPDGRWTYYVLAKRQTNDCDTYAIWLCACVSPFETDMAGHDTYARDVMSHCRRIK